MSKGAFMVPDYSIKGLRGTHQNLVKHLEEFEVISTLRLIASLETLPELLANTIRIEILLHLAVSYCKGKRRATPRDLETWLAFLKESPMRMQEDPSEDVFVGYVCTKNGGFRVFQGIFSHADFILDRLLYFLDEKTNFPGFLEAYESVLEILKISEAIMGSVGLARYSASDSTPKGPILIPALEKLEMHANALHFDRPRLDKLRIDPTKLRAFIFSQSHVKKLSSEEMFGSSLELHPLLATDSGLLVMSPSSLCRAAVVRILEVAPNLGGLADTFFEKESAEFFVNRILRRIGVKKNGSIELPTAPDSLPSLNPFVGQFDHGMPVLALTMSSPLTKGPNLEEPEIFSEDQERAFTQYISECCAALEEIEGFEGGLILLGLSGVGRPLGIGIGDLNKRWHLFSAALADWETLVGDEDFSARRLWYLGKQLNLAGTCNVQIVNTSGLLNLYGFWKQQDFALIASEMNPKNPVNLMVIDGACSTRINSELKSIRDRHCRIHHDGRRWIELQRQGLGLNPDLSTNLSYCDFAAAFEGCLRGCLEYQDAAWWIETNNHPKNPSASNLVYRLWNCVFDWAEQTLPKLAKLRPELILKNLKIELEFPGIDQWSFSTVSELLQKPGDLRLTIDKQSSTARLIFGNDFLQKFYRPDNRAEREIVLSLVRSAAEISGMAFTETELQEYANHITKNENTRFFHIVRASTLESAIGSLGNAKPSLVPREEIARIETGLAYAFFEKPPRKITDNDEARKFLDKVVGIIQARICSSLKTFWILPIVSYSFSQLDELSRDSSRWSLSTRSLLSLEDEAEWLRQRLHVENYRRTLAEITNRVIIETAVYSFSPNATRIISRTEHASLLAEFAVMIELANYRDAVASDLVKADITIYPNGSIRYSDPFQEQVFQPYLKSRLDDKIQWDADDYESHFEVQSREVGPSISANPEIRAFEKVFEAEFGFPYDTLTKVINAFDEFAIQSEETGGTIDFPTFNLMLKNGIGLSDKQTATFLDRFVLPIRLAWNKNFPKGCDANDVLPWRFFRGISILVRPFVEISRSPAKYAISASHLHRWLLYLTHSILERHLPEKLFFSPAMKSYLGNVAHKKGHEFAESVGALVKRVFPNVEVEIKMTTLGASADPDLGDVDVLAWDSKTDLVLLIECKWLKAALTVRQVIQQLEEFRGESKSRDDSLAKHQRRVSWLQMNPAGISNLTGIPLGRIHWISLLVTSGRVPMSYLDATGFPKNQVIPFQEFEAYIQHFAENAPNFDPVRDSFRISANENS